jgi:ABC-type transporter Mla subunit MlaD
MASLMEVVESLHLSVRLLGEVVSPEGLQSVADRGQALADQAGTAAEKYQRAAVAADAAAKALEAASAGLGQMLASLDQSSAAVSGLAANLGRRLEEVVRHQVQDMAREVIDDGRRNTLIGWLRGLGR